MAKKNTKNKTKAAKRIREGDLVFILAGNDKGRKGKVLSRVGTDKAIIEGINIKTKHVKAQQGQQGGIVKMEAPIDLSNVRLCVDEEQPRKVKVKLENGQKDLVYLNGSDEVLIRTIKKPKEKAQS